jgi:flagellar hook-associated protein 3 FlgL
MLRVTDQSMSLAAQRALGASQARLAAAQEAATSGARIGRPSDDPIGAGDALHVRAELAAMEQYKRNIDDGAAWLTTLDSALGGAASLLRQVRDAVIQGSNGSLNQDARDALAQQVDSLRGDVLATANTRYLGRSVFAGTSDAEAAFTDGAPPAPPAFNGAAGAVHRRIGPDRTVRVDTDGGAAFGTGPTSVFVLLDRISADLRAGVDPAPHLTALDDAMTTIVAARSDVGSRLAQLNRAGQASMEATLSLEARRSGIEDIDLGKAALDLQLQHTAYQAALAVTAKVLQPSLVDFLR